MSVSTFQQKQEFEKAKYMLKVLFSTEDNGSERVKEGRINIIIFVSSWMYFNKKHRNVSNYVKNLQP